MKKGLCLLVVFALTMSILLVACDQGESQGSEQETKPVESSGKLEFETNGDGTCSLVGIGTYTGTIVKIPEISPEGDTVTVIKGNAFANCEQITNITIPDSVLQIGDFAFSNCKRLTGIHIPASVEFIGHGIVSGCSDLADITVDEGNKEYRSESDCLIYGKTLLAGCKNSIIPEEITRIDTYAFMSCSGLTEIVIPEGVESIRELAFSGCTGLIAIELPSSLINIGDNAFSGCTGLTRVELPNGLKSIGYHAFMSCSALTAIEIPDTVEKVDQGAFVACSSLTSITVSSDNDVYKSLGNCLYEKKSKTLIAGCKTSVIPAGIISIGFEAFAGCDGLTEITLPKSMEDIDGSAFIMCTDLSSIEVDSENKTYYSENNCVIERATNTLKLGCKTSVIPDSVTSIGNFAFRSCPGLTSITIPDSVTSIGVGAFSGCTALTDVYFTGTEEEWDAINFQIGNDDLMLATIHYNYVPEE